MEGGMICTCDERTLDQLGATREEFRNFHCAMCGRFIHQHYTPETNPTTELCAKCDYHKADAWTDLQHWYWTDDGCIEPIGPFDTRSEAVADYRSTRPLQGALSRPCYRRQPT